MCICPACGYEKRTKQIPTEKVIRYKSGKNKGDIKEVKEELIDVYPDDPDFIDLEYKKDVDQLVMNDKDGWNRYYRWGRFMDDREPVDLKCCPKCGNVIVGQINKERYHR